MRKQTTKEKTSRKPCQKSKGLREEVTWSGRRDGTLSRGAASRALSDLQAVWWLGYTALESFD